VEAAESMIPLLVAALSTSSLHETFRLALVASLLGLISTAWYVLHVFNSRMAVLRGVEQGFSVIRAANQGLLTVSDPYGPDRRRGAERRSACHDVVGASATWQPRNSVRQNR
jgi:hypothetical protein